MIGVSSKIIGQRKELICTAEQHNADSFYLSCLHVVSFHQSLSDLKVVSTGTSLCVLSASNGSEFNSDRELMSLFQAFQLTFWGTAQNRKK
jgi:hypothetical protein